MVVNGGTLPRTATAERNVCTYNYIPFQCYTQKFSVLQQPHGNRNTYNTSTSSYSTFSSSCSSALPTDIQLLVVYPQRREILRPLAPPTNQQRSTWPTTFLFLSQSRKRPNPWWEDEQRDRRRRTNGRSIIIIIVPRNNPTILLLCPQFTNSNKLSYLQFWFLCSESLAPISVTLETSKMNIKIATPPNPLRCCWWPAMASPMELQKFATIFNECRSFRAPFSHRLATDTVDRSFSAPSMSSLSWRSWKRPSRNPPPFQAAPRDVKPILSIQLGATECSCHDTVHGIYCLYLSLSTP